MTNDRDHVGDCFIVAAGIVTSAGPVGDPAIDRFEHRLRLVHGAILGAGGVVEGRYYWHAWVEADVQMPFPHPELPGRVRYHGVAWAIDRSNGQNMVTSADYYRQRAAPRMLVEYGPDEARDQLLRTGNYGPWIPDYDAYVDV